MAFPIGQNPNQNQNQVQAQFVPPQRPQGNFQQAVQRLGQAQQQQPQGLAGPSQDAMLSFSPEAMEQMAQSQGTQQRPSGPSPDQLESQIQSGDLQGALSTISQLDANRPSQGTDPNQALKTQLKELLQQGDQQGAEETLEQIKANRPSGPPPQQQQ